MVRLSQADPFALVRLATQKRWDLDPKILLRPHRLRSGGDIVMHAVSGHLLHQIPLRGAEIPHSFLNAQGLCGGDGGVSEAAGRLEFVSVAKTSLSKPITAAPLRSAHGGQIVSRQLLICDRIDEFRSRGPDARRSRRFSSVGRRGKRSGKCGSLRLGEQVRRLRWSRRSNRSRFGQRCGSRSADARYRRGVAAGLGRRWPTSSNGRRPAHRL